MKIVLLRNSLCSSQETIVEPLVSCEDLVENTLNSVINIKDAIHYAIHWIVIYPLDSDLLSGLLSRPLADLT